MLDAKSQINIYQKKHNYKIYFIVTRCITFLESAVNQVHKMSSQVHFTAPEHPPLFLIIYHLDKLDSDSIIYYSTYRDFGFKFKYLYV